MTQLSQNMPVNVKGNYEISTPVKENKNSQVDRDDDS